MITLDALEFKQVLAASSLFKSLQISLLNELSKEFSQYPQGLPTPAAKFVVQIVFDRDFADEVFALRDKHKDGCTRSKPQITIEFSGDTP